MAELKARAERITHHGAHAMHYAYLAAVGVEAHGMYRWAAVALLIFLLLDVLLGGTSGAE